MLSLVEYLLQYLTTTRPSYFIENYDNELQNGQNKKSVAHSSHKILDKEDNIVSNHETMNTSTET